MPRQFVPAHPAGRPRARALRLLLLGLLGATLPVQAASPPAGTGHEGMVVSADTAATQAGVATLRAGGNAIDAAAACALALAVTLPYAGNLGGGGMLLYRDPDGQTHALDFRDAAPRRLRPGMFLDEDGRPLHHRALRGGLAVAVPGTVAGLFEAQRRWGRLEWRRLVEPAIRLAERGKPVSAWMAGVYAGGEHLLDDPGARAIFAPEGRLPLEGDVVRQTDLAATLRRIGAEGAKGFYEGPTAEAIVRTIEARGGIMDGEDLARYRPVSRDPVVGRYRGHRVVSFPPPSSGGLILLQMLAMLEHFELEPTEPLSSRTVHLLAEVERRAYADRSRWLGDPDFFDVPARGLLDPLYIDARVATIRPKRASRSERLLPGRPPGVESDETTHLSVADRWGGAVTLTTTLNGAFGCGMVAEGTGVLLNNQIDDFSLAPGMPNQWGLLGGEANAVAGGKRPLSSMTPTIVDAPDGGRPLLVLGSPGGSKIITSVLQVLVHVIDHEMPLQQAVDFPRFHHQWYPDVIRYERLALPADVRSALAKLGHELEQTGGDLGNVNAIGTDARGRWLGAADPRRHGSALGY